MYLRQVKYEIDLRLLRVIRLTNGLNIEVSLRRAAVVLTEVASPPADRVQTSHIETHLISF